jgi:hypothetical protein
LHSLRGDKPFEGKDPVESLNKTIREEPPSITIFNRDVPSDLQRVVRCLAKDPEVRYQTIKDVSIELKEVRGELQHHVVHAKQSLKLATGR